MEISIKTDVMPNTIQRTGTTVKIFLGIKMGKIHLHQHEVTLFLQGMQIDQIVVEQLTDCLVTAVLLQIQEIQVHH